MLAVKTKTRSEVDVRIPLEIARKYHMQNGDVLDVHDLGTGIIFVHPKVIKNKKLRQKVNERLWDIMEQEADNDIKAGRVSGPFDSIEDLLKDLKR